MPENTPAITAMIENILDKIEMRRQTVGIGKTDMLKRAGVSPKTLSHMKAGTPPNTRTLLAIAHVLDVSVDYFLCTEKTPGALDLDALERAIKAVEEELTRRSRVTTRKRKTAAIARLYEGFVFVEKNSDTPENDN